MSKASVIATEIHARVATIATAGGYLTNIGATVYRGRLKLEKDFLPCSVIVEGDDSIIATELKKVKLAQRYMIEGHAACDPDNPNDTAHQIIADLKKAIFAPSVHPTGTMCIRYVGRTISPREDGADIVAASIEIEVDYVEDLTSP